MLRFFVVVGIFAAMTQAHITPLPFVDVSSWSDHDTQQFVNHLPAESHGGWWVRIGDKIFSPSVKVDEDAVVDKQIHHYWIVMGQLPSALKEQVAASDTENQVNIVHSIHKPVTSSASSSEPVQAKNKFRLFVKVRSPHVTRADMSLEEDVQLTAALGTISDESYMQEIVRITSIGTGRNVAIEGHTTAEKYLGCRMQKAGLETRFLQFDMRGSKGTDVIGCTKGAKDKKFLMVGAHFDTLPSPPEKSPGAMDNGSGVGVVMSSMEAVSQFKFAHSVCFTGFDGEELGLLGSHHVANMIKDKPELSKNFLGAITSDMSTGFKAKAGGNRDPGWDDDNTQVVANQPKTKNEDGIHIDGDHHSEALVKMFSRIAKEVVNDKSMPILESEASIWNSDQKSFFSAGLPAIDICAADHRRYMYWHHKENRTENIDPHIGTQIARTVVGAVMEIGDRIDPSLEEEEEEEENTFPAFDGAQTMQQLFGDVDCDSLISQHEAHAQSRTQAKQASTSVQEHGHHEHGHHGLVSSAVEASVDIATKAPIHHAVTHTQMSMEMARQLEEALSELETHLSSQ